MKYFLIIMLLVIANSCGINYEYNELRRDIFEFT